MWPLHRPHSLVRFHSVMSIFSTLLKMKYSVVIPCHDEEESIKNVIQSIPREIDEIIVVDNNSTDKTAITANRLGATVIFEGAKGYGKALKTGFQNARGDIIITFDGDGQHPAEKILEMVRYLEEKELDFLSGNRFPVDSSSLNITRILGNKLLTFFVNILFNLKIKDSQSGMWVFRKKVNEKIILESDDMALSEEIKIKVCLHPSLVFGEYPIPYHQRTGNSKLSVVKDGLKNLFLLLRLRLNKREAWMR